jgi:hypothetical protein
MKSKLLPFFIMACILKGTIRKGADYSGTGLYFSFVIFFTQTIRSTHDNTNTE